MQKVSLKKGEPNNLIIRFEDASEAVKKTMIVSKDVKKAFTEELSQRYQQQNSEIVELERGPSSSSLPSSPAEN